MLPRATNINGSGFGVTFFITSNRRSRYVAMIGRWPSRSGLAKSCCAGARLFSRQATVEEFEEHQESYRHVAMVFSAFHVMIRYIIETSGDGVKDKLRKRLSDDGFRARYFIVKRKFGANVSRWKKKKEKIAAIKEKNKPQMALPF